MIYTLTTNPSIDYYLYTEKDVKLGINRPEGYKFVAAGKGVNVSRVLANLGKDNKCVIVSGGFTGKYICEETNKIEHIEVINVEIVGESRVNIKIRTNGNEMDLNTSGPELTDENKKELVRVFEQVGKEDLVCFNGSLQKGMKDTIVEIAELLKQKGAKLVLDVPNLSLEDILKCSPFMIKPNDDELRALLNTDAKIENLIELAQEKLCTNGINILLSLGGSGSCFVSKDTVLKVNCPKVEVVNTVGAGDSLLAGFMFMLDNKASLNDCLRYASATGSAAVSGHDLPAKNKVEELLGEVRCYE